MVRLLVYAPEVVGSNHLVDIFGRMVHTMVHTMVHVYTIPRMVHGVWCARTKVNILPSSYPLPILYPS